MPPECNPHDDEPIDREEWEAAMTVQGKPDRCPVAVYECPWHGRGHDWKCDECHVVGHDSSPVPAAAPQPKIEEIATDLAWYICDDMVHRHPDIKTLLLQFAKEIQRASIEPTGF